MLFQALCLQPAFLTFITKGIGRQIVSFLRLKLLNVMSNSAHAVPERRKPSSTLCGQDTTEEFTDELTQSILYTFYKAEITMK